MVGLQRSRAKLSEGRQKIVANPLGISSGMTGDCHEPASAVDVTASAPIYDASAVDTERQCFPYQHQYFPAEEHRHINMHRTCDLNYVMDEIR